MVRAVDRDDLLTDDNHHVLGEARLSAPRTNTVPAEFAICALGSQGRPVRVGDKLA